MRKKALLTALVITVLITGCTNQQETCAAYAEEKCCESHGTE